MRKVKFYARGPGIVTHPGTRPIVGNMPRYVGRRSKMVDGSGIVDGVLRYAPQASYPVKQEGDIFPEKSREARQLIRRVRKEELWAANEETAKFCGVPYVALEFTDGEWSPRKQSAPKKQSKGRTSPSDSLLEMSGKE